MTARKGVRPIFIGRDRDGTEKWWTNTTPTYVYRYYDQFDRLLYVGIACDLVARDKAHLRKSKWRLLAVHKAVKLFPNKYEALDEELNAIHTEFPIHNVVGNPHKIVWRYAA